MQSLAFLTAVLYALFLWWFVTGLIVVVYGRSRWVVNLYFVCATIIMVLALAGLVLTRQQTQPAAVYLALTCGILIWAWQVTAYYLGYVTGPRHIKEFLELLPAMNNSQMGLFFRFRHALQASLFHELLIVGFVVLLAGILWNAANKWGLWIFLALWVMHSLAKLNVFFGVRNFRIEFLPAHLHYLDVVLSKQKNNLLLLLTIVVGLASSLVFFYQGIIPGVMPGQAIGFLVVGTMIALGVIEHLLLVLPLPAILWGWGIRLLPQPKLQQIGSECETTTVRAMLKRTGCSRLIR